jgi:hypothetical protein
VRGWHRSKRRNKFDLEGAPNFLQGGVIMIMLRLLAVFIFSALLTGLDIKELKAETEESTNQCSQPGFPSSGQCWYDLHVTKINKDGTVTAKYTQRLIDKEKADPKAVFTFPVRNLEWLVSKGWLKEKEDHLFTNGYGSPFLEPFTSGYDYTK